MVSLWGVVPDLQIFVTPPVNGKVPAGELARRDPQLFATSAMADGAEAHSHIAPFVGPAWIRRRPLEAVLAALSGAPVPYGQRTERRAHICKNPAPPRWDGA